MKLAHLNRKAAQPKSRSTSPRVEPLENRIVFATHVWIGASGGVWSNAANWAGGAPTTGEGGGTIVQFDSNIASVDNIAGLIVDQIHFTGDGNTISASVGVTLGLSGTVVNTNLLNDSGTNTVSAPLNLTGSTIFTVVTAGQLTLSGAVGGATGLRLHDGSANGILELANSGPTGTVTVREGTLLLDSNGSNDAIKTALVVGDGTGAAGTAVVRFSQSTEIANTATVTVNTDGLLDLNNFNDTIGDLTLTTGTSAGASITTGTGTLNLGADVSVAIAGTGATASTIAGKLAFAATTPNFSIGSGTATSELIISATIDGTAGFSKSGTGALEIANTVANTVTGTVSVSDGTLFLNSAGTNVAILGDLTIGNNAGTAGSAVLLLGKADQIADTSTVSLNNEGLLNLNNFNEAVSFVGLTTGTTTASSVTTGTGILTVPNGITVNVSGTGAIGSTISGNLTFGNTTGAFTIGDGGAVSDLTVSADIGGSAGFSKSGVGTLQLANAVANTNTGSVFVFDGTLSLNSGGTDTGITQSLTIGDGSGTTGSAVLQLLKSDGIADGIAITINGDGKLDLSGFSDTVGALTLKSSTASGASISTGAGVLTLSSNVAVQVNGTGATSATIAGNLSMGTSTRTFNVADGDATSDLVVSAKISGSAGFTKSGTGTFELANTSANTYTGTVTVAAGTLLLNSNGSNDAIVGDLVIGTDTGTTATVAYSQSTEISNTATVTIASDGVFDLSGGNEAIGALILTAGTSTGATVTTGTRTLTLGGDVTLVSSGTGATGATIDGLLNLGSTNLVNNGRVFTIADTAASSDLLITATISGTAGLTKNGLGTLTLKETGATDNSFSGTTTIADGVLLLTSTASFTSVSSTVVVGDDTGARSSAVLRFGISSVIPDAASVTVLSDGLFDLANRTDGLGAFTLNASGSLDLGTGTLSAGGGLTLNTGGSFLSNSGHVNVTGAVSVAGQLTFKKSGGAATLGDTFTLIDNDSNDAVTGTFDNLAEGTIFGTNDGLRSISYIGGDGNDVVLTAVDATNAAFVTILPGGKSATFTDVDGDLVTVKTSVGTFAKTDFIFGVTGSGITTGFQLQKLNLTDPKFLGSKISFSAKPGVLGGNGQINVGLIDATGQDIGAITLPGDLGRILAGDATPVKPGVGVLSVGSFGELSTTTQGIGGTLSSDVLGAGSLIVKGNIRDARLTLAKAGTISIGGSILGTAVNAGQLSFDSATKVTIGGDVRGVGVASGLVISTGLIGSLTINGSVIGGSGANSGHIEALGIKTLAIKGDIRGGSGSGAGAVAITTTPDLVGIGKGLVGGSIIGGSAALAGAITSGGLIGSLTVAGSLVGGTNATSGQISSSGDIKSLTIGRDLVGSASIISGAKLTALTIKGQVMADSASSLATISAYGAATAPATGPDIAIGSLTIGKSVENLRVLAGYLDGVASNADASISKVSVGGDFRASSILVGVSEGSDGVAGTADDVKAVLRDTNTRFSTIASLTIKGQATGTTATGDTYAIMAEQIISAKIGNAAVKLKSGARNSEDTFAFGYASIGLFTDASDFYLREVTAT